MIKRRWNLREERDSPYVLFDERLDAVAIVGMAACAAAVLLVNRRSKTV